jgi:hypothetical protein
MSHLVSRSNLKGNPMTKPTAFAAGGALPSNQARSLPFDVKRGMYGSCKRIRGQIGLAGEIFAQAFFWDIEKRWDIEVFNADGSIGEYSINVVDREQAIRQVQAIMDLEYSAKGRVMCIDLKAFPPSLAYNRRSGHPGETNATGGSMWRSGASTGYLRLKATQRWSLH